MKEGPVTTKQWEPVEIHFTSEVAYDNPYTEVDVWVELTHSSGTKLKRPAFWNGGRTWTFRFASPEAKGSWAYCSFCSANDAGLSKQSGSFIVDGTSDSTVFERHGLLKMSPKGLNVVHHDGTGCFLAGDTAWALPWRATTDQCRKYARNRQQQGFNMVLLMTLQPDMNARGPRDRQADEGFDVAFDDLPGGHINHINMEYFQYMDKLISILLDHEIVPAYQPVFHGYGWKGLSVLGTVVDPDEYRRYCRYLVARFGAWPAVYVVGADGFGTEPGIEEGGREIEDWDCYEQPAGIHYNPMASNNQYQSQTWLDFQWCQTGHAGEHRQEKIGSMIKDRPRKACANAEPTYERMGGPDKATGWWQGHEAWINLCAGGTMAVVYGAASLWQWKLRPGEPGHQEWCSAGASGWEEACDFEGSRYVGLVRKILAGCDYIDMEPDPQALLGRRCCLKPDSFAVAYLEQGGGTHVRSCVVPKKYAVIDPLTGDIKQKGEIPDRLPYMLNTNMRSPCIILFTN